jgi:small subunit ribosomal protein S18
MSKKKTSSRARVKDANPRKFKKKTSPLVIEKVEYIDYKDIDLLQRFMSDRAKIRNRRVSGNDVQQQREIAKAIKNAREMALLPYAKRVASTGRGRGSRDDDRGRYDPRPERAADEVVDDTVEEIIDEMVEEIVDDVAVEMATSGEES